MTLDVVARALARAGALVEAADGGALEALLSPELAAAWELPEHALLATDRREGSVAAGHGSPLLRAAIERATRGVAAAVCAPLPAPRPGPPEAYSGLNVALRAGAPAPAAGWTLTAHLRLDATADDRRLLPLTASVAVEEGCPIPTPAWTTLEPLGGLERPPPALLAAAEPALARAALAAAMPALDPFREAVARRRRRDALRIDRYFVEVDADLRRRADAGGADAKRAALVAERARRLATLRDDATLRARLEVVALLLVRAPVALAPLEVLRRKARRTVNVRFHAALRIWLPLACEGCGEPTRAIGACDDEVHLLCTVCVDARRCPRCERGGPPSSSRVDAAGVEEVVRVEGPALGEAPAAATGGPARGAPAKRVPAAATVRRARAPAPAPAPASRDDAAAAPASGAASRPAGAGPAPARRAAREADAEAVGRVREALRALSSPLTSLQLQELTGLDAPAVRAGLGPLLEAGLVERTGQTKGTRYGWVGGR